MTPFARTLAPAPAPPLRSALLAIAMAAATIIALPAGGSAAQEHPVSAGSTEEAGSSEASGATEASLPGGGPEQERPVVVFLVRHAEKAEDGTDDPPLAVAGQIRVRILGALLADAGLTHVHTTDWKRTRETARPIAEAAGLEYALYDPGAPDEVAEAIKATPGTHLVVGHSNTTPQLVSALGGDPSSPIDELEYDRLYVVTVLPDQAPLTTLLRFGEPYVEGQDFSLRAAWGPTGPRSLAAFRDRN